MRLMILMLITTAIMGCSVFGKSKVDIAPYQVLETAAPNIDVRIYERLVLASTPMSTEDSRDRREPFMRLFGYISGENIDERSIAMTAPVFRDEAQAGQKIAMTAPVFMEENAAKPTMSFVLPASFTLENAPQPTNAQVSLHQVTQYKAAVIRFSGRLTSANIAKHRAILEKWLQQRAYQVVGPFQVAGYNAPFTLPALRRNEVLIPLE